nr:DUF5979 domain-containing protein [Tessaracoccus coleopterorum]
MAGNGANLIDPEIEFSVQLECVADIDGEQVTLPLPDDGLVTLSQATSLEATYENLPIGASCTLTEPGDGGAVAVDITPATVVVGGEQAEITVTNTFTAASLEVTKDITKSALDASGEPVDHGKFDFTVECTFQDRPVLATGFTTTP